MADIDDVLREAVIAYLKAYQNVKDVIGQRIFPETLPQNLKTFPAAVITRSFVDRKRSKTGLTGITDSRVAITTTASRKIGAAKAANTIEGAIVKLNDTRQMGDLEVKKAYMEDQDDFYAENVEMHLIESEYLITHENEE